MYLKSGLEEGCPFVGVALYERSYDFILNNGIKYYYYFTFYVTGLVILGDAHKKGDNVNGIVNIFLKCCQIHNPCGIRYNVVILHVEYPILTTKKSFKITMG